VRTALFWVITQRVVVTSYQIFWTTYRSYPHFGFLNPEDGTDTLSQKSVRNYHYFAAKARNHAWYTSVRNKPVVVIVRTERPGLSENLVKTCIFYAVVCARRIMLGILTSFEYVCVCVCNLVSRPREEKLTTPTWEREPEETNSN